MTRIRRPPLASLLALATLALAACDVLRPPAPPPHEFLVAAGDSTYWVRGGLDDIVPVRSSPLLLARLDGRFYELYVTDDDRSFYDAIFIGQRVYRRDLLSGDSLLVYEDSLIPTLARTWARRHPADRPLGPRDESSDDPETFASVELEILDLHGPYLSYEYHRDVEARSGDGTHFTRWGVLDVRRGGRATLADLYGGREAERLVREGRSSFGATIDSMLAAGTSDPRTLDALSGFAFDSTSFTIVQIGSESGVAFLVPGSGPAADGLTLELDPIPAGSPPWWRELEEELPEPTDDPDVDRWRHPGYVVLARYHDTSMTAEIVVAAGERTWPVASVATPVLRIEWLDAPPLDSAWRSALGRAFNEAVLYDPDARIAREAPRRRAGAPILTSNTRP